MLVGLFGVGKIEIVLVLVEVIYGGEQNLVIINMSEFQEVYIVFMLKGVFFGYVGYGEGGVLMEVVCCYFWSVVLFDEIEKVYYDVYKFFYQVFDKGGMEDGEGIYVDFKNIMLLFIINVGFDFISQMCEDLVLMFDVMGFKEVLMLELCKYFLVVFLGCVMVIFYLLLDEMLCGVIVYLYFDWLVVWMSEQYGVMLMYSEELVVYIVVCCLMYEMGVWLLIGYIEQYILL